MLRCYMNPIWIVTLIILLMYGCSSTGIQVHLSPQQNFNSNAYSYFLLATPKLTTKDGFLEQAVYVDHEIREQISNQLTSKGYKKTTKQQTTATLFVNYKITRELTASREGKRVSNVDVHGGINQGINDSIYSPAFYTEPSDLYEAYLTISVTDAETKKVLWQGSVTKIIVNQDADEKRLKNKLTEAITKLLKKFPAKNN